MPVILSISLRLSHGALYQWKPRPPQNTPVQSRGALTETLQVCDPSDCRKTTELTVIDVAGVEKLKWKRQTDINKTRIFLGRLRIPGLHSLEELGLSRPKQNQSPTAATCT